MSSKEINFYLIISLALILGTLSDYLFYQKSVGVSFFIFILAVAVFSLILAKKFDKKISKIQIFVLIATILLSAALFLRFSSFLGFFNFLGGVYLLFLFFALFLEKDILNFNFPKYFISPLSFFLKSFSGAARFLEKNRETFPRSGKIGSKEFRSMLKGIAIAAPFLAIFIWLLSSADLIFQSYLGKIIDFNVNIDFQIISRLLTILVVSYFFAGFFSKAIENGESTIANEEVRENKFLDFIESSTVLVLVELLFLAFIAVQFFYLFGGKNYVWGIDEYITYAAYAKKGFYELLEASIVSFFLIYGLDKFGKRENIKERKIFKILSSVLIFEISIIIYSAFTRLSVYTDGYGLTFSRFLAFSFMLWIFIVFLIFLCKKIILEKKESVFLFSAFCLTILFWIGINVLNPDAYIAKQNIERLVQGKKLDSYYFSGLSEDAVPEIVKIFRLERNEDIKIEIAGSLYWRYDSPPNSLCNIYDSYKCNYIAFKDKLEYAEKRQKQNWQSFNFSRAKALSALKDNYREIEKYQLKFWEKGIRECKERCVNNKSGTLADCEKECERNMYEWYGKNMRMD